MDVFSVNADSVFTIASSQNAQKEGYAQRYLEKGLEAYTSENYVEAIASFKQVIGLSPQSGAALNALEYMALSFSGMGDTEAAIETYKTMIRAEPTLDSTHTALANLYYSNDRFDEALLEYEQAFKLNPNTANRYSLGQGYLATGRNDEALQQFDIIRQQAPGEPQGYFGMGQAYARMERHDAAIDSFKRAIGVQSDYWEAYAEMGYAYVDSGDSESADAIVSQLADNDASLSALLSQYVYEKSPPKMAATYSTSDFTQFLDMLGPGTAVSVLSSDLLYANAEETFAVNILFSKPMDRASVENVANWNIARAPATGAGSGYNHSLPVASTEVTLSPYPTSVYYNSETQSATVLFKIRQNADANGTLDPSHINFTFTGKDELGLAMDPSADTYSGFSGFA